MNDMVKCPVCRNIDGGGQCQKLSTNGKDSFGFECVVCGRYEISRTAFAGKLNPAKECLTPVQRASLSHRLRIKSRDGETVLITTEWLDHFLAGAHLLPSPIVQATNIIRFIGDEVSRTGRAVDRLPVDFQAIIGAPHRLMSVQLVKELDKRGQLMIGNKNGANPSQINLTLDGWKRYEDEKRGKFAGNYGFIAMQFNKPRLEALVKEVLKPAVKEDVGYDLVDMRDVARAGLIDNIMRTRIRDAKFVIADLTHDNSGAYWEAGYAEGLGKPVIYICEKGKFDKEKTHFDTNHCTTVPWSRGDDEGFRQQLTATLRRSLDESS